MRKVETNIVIERPIEEIFEFVSNPENDPMWQSGVQESRLASEGPKGVGSRLLEVRQFLCRRIESLSEVTGFERNAKIGFKSTSGLYNSRASTHSSPSTAAQRSQWSPARTQGGSSSWASHW